MFILSILTANDHTCYQTKSQKSHGMPDPVL